MIVDNRIFWGIARFKETMDFHWCEIGRIVDQDAKLQDRFKMFCRKSDCKCFVEDIFTDTLIEFNGAKAQGIRICKNIIEKENEKLSNDTALA